MSRSRWNECIGWTSGDGTALTNTVTATSLLPPGPAKPTLPNNFFQEVGDRLGIRACGRVSTVVTTPGTLTLDIRFGGSIVVFNGGAMALNIVAQTNATWLYEAILECRAIGSGTSATLLGIGKWTSRASIGNVAVATAGVLVTPLPDTAPAAGSGFDSTAGQAVDMFGTWSIANASNSITLHQFEIYAVN